MSTTVKDEVISLQARDVSGQRVVKVAGVKTDTTIGELVRELVPKMALQMHDSQNRPLSYHVRLEREGRHLHHAEVVGDSLRTGDEISLHPNVMAGGV